MHMFVLQARVLRMCLRGCRVCKAQGWCVKAHFVDPLCRARVQPWASFSTGHWLQHARSWSACTGKWAPYALDLLPQPTDHRHPANRMHNCLRFLSKSCFQFLPLFLSPLASFLSPLCFRGGLFNCRGAGGFLHHSGPGCSCKPHGEAMDYFPAHSTRVRAH